MNKKEIEVGEYIRTKRGEIGKILILYGKDSCYKNMNNYSIDTIDGAVYEEDIIKHSKNIINLIEVGDIVEYEYDGYYHKADIFQSTYYNLAITSVNDGIIDLEERPEIIKRILTKEQYEQNSYKL